MYFLYRILIKSYFKLIKFAAYFRTDARQWLEGRKNISAHFKNSKTFNSQKKSIWIHAASLGEFEQGRPLIELIKKNYPDQQIVLTFFSPSGFEIQKNYTLADVVTYFLSDLKDDADEMITLINPALVIFIKYEFWFNTLTALDKKAIPVIFISAIFRENSYLFSSYAKILLNKLKNVNHLFLQNESSFILLQDKKFTNISIVGDTRMDRVLDIANQDYKNERIEQFIGNNKVLIFGSLWEEDLMVIKQDLLNCISQSWKIIIAPHKIDADSIQKIEYQLPNLCLRYSDSSQNLNDVLIIDSIGILSKIYRYADFVYIGGGFGKGIHNILEALAYLKPVAFGPNYQKFNEANFAIEHQFAFEVKSQGDLLKIINQAKGKRLEEIKIEIGKYLNENKAASQKIIEYLQNQKLIPV